MISSQNLQKYSQKNVCVSPLIFQKEVSKDSSFSLSDEGSFLCKQTITILYFIIIIILSLVLCTLVPRYCRLVPRGTKVHDFREGKRMSPESKVQLKVWVSYSADKAIRQLIQAKYPKFLNGLLSFEVENAILRYTNTENKNQSEINTEARTHQKQKEIKKRDYNRQKAFVLKDQISKWLMGEPYRYENPYHVSYQHLKEGICKFEGVVDKRSIRNRISLLVSNECIKKDVDSINDVYNFMDNTIEMPNEEIAT